MSVLSPELVRRIVRRHHTVTTRELLDDGLARRDLERWVGAGALVELSPDVYALGDALLHTPFHTRAAAACLPGDRVCDAITSARIWDLPGVFRPTRPSTVSVSDVPAAHVVTRRDGIRLLSVPATWFGLCEVLTPAAYARWSDGVLDGAVDVVAAHRVVRRSADHRRSPHRRAAALLSARRSWQRPAGAAMERRVRASLRRRGVDRLDGTHAIELGDRMLRHPTVVDHRLRWGVEIDHRSWHGGRHSEELGDWIERRTRLAGWTIHLVTDRRLDRDFNGEMARLAASYRTTATAA